MGLFLNQDYSIDPPWFDTIFELNLVNFQIYNQKFKKCDIKFKYNEKKKDVIELNAFK